MSTKPLVLRGARQNNLKNIDLEIPTGQLVVITGLSGSGKSSLAFDTIYAEGHRRFLDSLSNYARQFLVRVERPEVDSIEGLAPTIAIEQKNPIRTSRSTVGTVTEVYDFLRLLYARAGASLCPQHRTPIQPLTVEQLTELIWTKHAGDKGVVAFPITVERTVKKRTEQLARLRTRGFHRVVLGDPFDGYFLPVIHRPRVKPMEELETSDLPKGAKQSLWLLVDRFSVNGEKDNLTRARDAVRVALEEGKGIALFAGMEGEPSLLSSSPRCVQCGTQMPALMPHLFSFNNPLGACAPCHGFGRILKIAESKVIPNPTLTIAQGVIEPFTKPSTEIWNRRLRRFCDEIGIDIHTPYSDLSEAQKRLVFEGNETFSGVNGMFTQLEEKRYKISSRVFLNRYQESVECASCHGARLRLEARSVVVDGKNIDDACRLTLKELHTWVERLHLQPDIAVRVGALLTQLKSRLNFLVEVGVGYLTCHRAARSLSGGEVQRINLSNQLGADLTRTFYVLDEPTVGLHPRDTQRLIGIMKNLRDRGNSLFVVEHDREVIQSADWLVDIGPGAGREGGEVVYNGPPGEFLQKKANRTKSLTAQYLSQEKIIPVPSVRRRANRGFMELRHCTGNNLKDVSLRVPLGRLVVVSGVSGSGKSSLVRGTLYPAVMRALHSEFVEGLPYGELAGVEKINECLMLDQSPIGRTPRMIPASYIKVFDQIRTLFAEQLESKKLGLRAGDFSFNVSGGRCDVCEGEGYQRVEMYFMDDLFVKCEECEGKRFQNKILDIRVNGKNIHDVLEMTVEEGMRFFHAHLSIYQGLNALHDVGLSYLQLGQPATTLSGGEAQRLKIARELFSRHGKNILYVLDEPTTGLHLEDVRKLIELLNRLVDQGNTVLVVEHHMDLIKSADWLIDLGPDAADHGGTIVAEGVPEDVARNSTSLIAPWLKEFLNPAVLAKPVSGSEELLDH